MENFLLSSGKFGKVKEFQNSFFMDKLIYLASSLHVRRFIICIRFQNIISDIGTLSNNHALKRASVNKNCIFPCFLLMHNFDRYPSQNDHNCID